MLDNSLIGINATCVHLIVQGTLLYRENTFTNTIEAFMAPGKCVYEYVYTCMVPSKCAYEHIHSGTFTGNALEEKASCTISY